MHIVNSLSAGLELGKKIARCHWSKKKFSQESFTTAVLPKELPSISKFFADYDQKLNYKNTS